MEEDIKKAWQNDLERLEMKSKLGLASVEEHRLDPVTADRFKFGPLEILVGRRGLESWKEFEPIEIQGGSKIICQKI